MYMIREFAQAAKAREVAATLPSIRLDIHGADVWIASNSPRLVHLIREGYAYFEVATESKVERRSEPILALTSEGEEYDRIAAGLLGDRPCPPHCIVAGAHARVYHVASARTLTYMTGSMFTAQMEAALFDDYLVVHGAAVDMGRGGLLMAGALRCGKSTLTLGLIYRGFRFATDDIVLLNRRSLEVHPYPRLINIRERSLGLVPGLHRDYGRLKHSSSFGEPRWFLDKSDRVAEPFPVKALIFPAVAEHLALTELRPSEAALRLIANCYYPHTPGKVCADTSVNLGTIEKLLARVDSFELRHGPPRETLDLLVSRFGSGHQRETKRRRLVVEGA